ncbi:MAG: hypothetical protein DRR42_11025 [Gammaproteobacteria bacterium]|nr:MAG: hypothetical protein DRR42_11025 [Gammaproteobacteria bacterium]
MSVDVFISYVRNNEKFATSLAASLQKQSITSWVDTEKIGPAEKWNAAVREGILKTHVFIVLLDKQWLNSKVCNDEYFLALEHAKTIEPVIVEQVDSHGWKKLELTVPDELQSRNYIFTHNRDFYDVVNDVVMAVRTNYDRKQLLSRYEQRAVNWKNSDEKFGLIRGFELQHFIESEQLSHDEEPEMTPLSQEFVLASQNAESRELEKVRKRERQADSKVLAAQSEHLIKESPGESLAYASDAWVKAPTVEALASLGSWFTEYIHLVGMWKLGLEVDTVAFDQGGDYLAASEKIHEMMMGETLRVWNVGDLGKIGDFTYPEGFAGCTWGEGQLVVQRRGNILSYRYDPFDQKFRQTSTGVVLPEASGKMVSSPSGELVAMPCVHKEFALYNIKANQAYVLTANGECKAIVWLDENVLLLIEGNTLTQRSLANLDEFTVLLELEHQIVAIDVLAGKWVALSMSDRARLHWHTAEGIGGVDLLSSPDPASVLRLDPAGKTAFIGGGGGGSTPFGITQVDIVSGQVIRHWLGGFDQAVTDIDLTENGYMAAGRSDGTVFLWNIRATVLDNKDDVEPAEVKTLRGEIKETDDIFVQKLEVLWDDENSKRIERLLPGPGRNNNVLPGSTPCVMCDEILGTGFGSLLLWYDLSSEDKPLKGKGHTNRITHIACSHINSLWVSLTVNYNNNNLMEIFVWNNCHEKPILQLLIPYMAIDEMHFDSSGEILLLQQNSKTVRQLLMDPDRWISSGQELSELRWSRS